MNILEKIYCRIFQFGFKVAIPLMPYRNPVILDNVENTVGLNKLFVIHVNDSKNPIGSHKDRHENLGYGEIGFDALNKVVHNNRVSEVPKILETPYVDDKPPYKIEIEMLKESTFKNWK